MRGLISRIFDAENFFKTEMALRCHFCFNSDGQFHTMKTRSSPNSLTYLSRTRWTNADRQTWLTRTTELSWDSLCHAL